MMSTRLRLEEVEAFSTLVHSNSSCRPIWSFRRKKLTNTTDGCSKLHTSEATRACWIRRRQFFTVEAQYNTYLKDTRTACTGVSYMLAIRQRTCLYFVLSPYMGPGRANHESSLRHGAQKKELISSLAC